ACGIDTAIAENTTIATPRIHAFHDAENSVPAKPSTHGDMNSHTPISRLSQSCQRFSFMTTPPVTKYHLDALRDSGFPLPDLIGHKNLAGFTTGGPVSGCARVPRCAEHRRGAPTLRGPRAIRPRSRWRWPPGAWP